MEAKRLAFHLFYNVLGHDADRPYLMARDLEVFFDSVDEVKEGKREGSECLQRRTKSPWQKRFRKGKKQCNIMAMPL